jgi:SSS family transporter
MSAIDWIVLCGTLAFIVGYGTFRTRRPKTADAYLRGGGDMKWYTIGISIMATQASAITFLSTPGQAYEDGMGFVQFYFGLPIAMVILSATIVPLYYKLKVYTAYEYLESRFDQKTRQLTAFLFLVQRGLAAGISIYAPAIVVSSVLGWPLGLTNLIIGALVVVYTVSGGTRAVAQTQSWQMAVMLGGMAVAFIYVLHALPPSLPIDHALTIAGSLGKMKIVDFSPHFGTRYTFWSGMAGGLFVALAYFGTDQSQVQRYLSGSSLRESRLGLLFNGLVKIPMQCFILLVGVAVFLFYQFHQPPIFWNHTELDRVHQSPRAAEMRALESQWADAFTRKKARIDQLAAGLAHKDTAATATARGEVQAAEVEVQKVREAAKKLIREVNPRAETKDADYVFISFVTQRLPIGLVGLLLAVIFCAAMSATASALTALGTTTVVDFYRRSWKKEASDAHYLRAAQLFTVGWGAVAVLFAVFASQLDNLIQAVNILGSIFYGPTLGVFLVGFFAKQIRATPVFIALCIAQVLVIVVFWRTSVSFLWYNVIGCAAVVALAPLVQLFTRDAER